MDDIPNTPTADNTQPADNSQNNISTQQVTLSLADLIALFKQHRHTGTDNLQINYNDLLNLPAAVSIPVKFGGNGQDGALTVSSGTTTIDLGGAAVVIKQYSSISITGTGNVAFSNKNSNGTKVIFLCSGGWTMTSSSSHVIDLRGVGGDGGAGNNGNTSGGAVTASPGKENIDDGITVISTGKFGLGSSASGGGTAIFGGGGASNYTAGDPGVNTTGNNAKAGTPISGLNLYLVGANRYLGMRGFLSPGAGGGGADNGFGVGGNSFTTSTNGLGGTLGSPDGGVGVAAASGGTSLNFAGAGGGGSGGGAFYGECAGAFNFTTGTIDDSGGKGGDGGTSTTNGYGGSGGGGGSGGTVIIYYNTLTANSGTSNIAGGIKGLGQTGASNNGVDGGKGGIGFSYIGPNQWFL